MTARMLYARAKQWLGSRVGRDHTIHAPDWHGVRLQQLELNFQWWVRVAVTKRKPGLRFWRPCLMEITISHHSRMSYGNETIWFQELLVDSAGKVSGRYYYINSAWIHGYMLGPFIDGYYFQPSAELVDDFYSLLSLVDSLDQD